MEAVTTDQFEASHVLPPVFWSGLFKSARPTKNLGLTWDALSKPIVLKWMFRGSRSQKRGSYGQINMTCSDAFWTGGFALQSKDTLHGFSQNNILVQMADFLIPENRGGGGEQVSVFASAPFWRLRRTVGCSPTWLEREGKQVLP